MRALSEADLLRLWERGRKRHPLDRALLALSSALPEEPYQGLADWPIGRRNQALARLRSVCFGHRLQAWLTCVKCGERLEFEMDVQALLGEEKGQQLIRGELITIDSRSFRLPTSRDLAQAVKETSPETGALRIATNCLTAGVPSDTWSEEDLAVIGEAMALADPQAETRLKFTCPECGNEWQETIDIALFFWTELEARVRQILFAIHALASAYGWSEADILALSDDRRATYVEMVQA